MIIFKMEFNCDNAAFEDAGASIEMAHILQNVALDILLDEIAGPIRDRNGNKIGQWEVTK